MKEILRKEFKEIFNQDAKYLFRAPGRSEIGGNHTDHQHGLIIAGAVDSYIYAAVSLNNTNIINVHSKGFKPFSFDINDLNIDEKLYGTSLSLCKGIAYRFKELNINLKGLDIYIISEILIGSGLSSSAAFEVLFAQILNVLFADNNFSKVDLALIGQYSENNFFGKPCGLMDQMAASIGGIINIDFKDQNDIKINSISYDFKKNGYTICIINSLASHENLTNEYSAITNELKEICKYFNKEYLREIKEEDFYQELKNIRKIAGDRAILRAIHIYNENKRVIKQIDALNNNDLDTFLKIVKESGLSSWRYLQNVIPTGSSFHQELALSLALAEEILKDQGVLRVHGGGFAGTLQAFIKNEYLDEFIKQMESYLTKGVCQIANIDYDGVVLWEQLS